MGQLKTNINSFPFPASITPLITKENPTMQVVCPNCGIEFSIDSTSGAINVPPPPRSTKLERGHWLDINGNKTQDWTKNVSTDPRTIEQNTTLKTLYDQSKDSRVFAQYANKCLTPTGQLVEKDVMVIPPLRTTEVNNVISRGKTLFILNEDGYPTQYYPTL